MTTHINRVNQGTKVNQRKQAVSSDVVRLAVQRAKDAVLADYAPRAGQHTRLLRLVLNEAEGLAWQTEFPHLVFPALAVEKAEAAVKWHQRQTALRRPAAEVAFAE
jgi:hypothetical protein